MEKMFWVLTQDPLVLCGFVLGVNRWTLGLESPKWADSSVITTCLGSVAQTLGP